jgi:hypothetical protein
VDGSTLSTAGTTEPLLLDWEGYTHPHPFLVIHGTLPEDGVLGMDVLPTYHTTISTHTHYIDISDPRALSPRTPQPSPPPVDTPPSSPNTHLFSVAAITIPPRSAQFISVPNPLGDLTTIFSPADLPDGLLTEHSISSGPSIRIRLTNLAQEPFTLASGTPLGAVESATLSPPPELQPRKPGIRWI